MKLVLVKPSFVKPSFVNAWLRGCALIVLLAAVSNLASPQRGGSPPPDSQTPGNSLPDTKLPNGKSQRDEILKAEHEANLKDAAQLVTLAQQLQEDMEKDDAFVLSMSSLKKTEDIEKLAKKIHSRLHH
jgi:hypothetical protein